jgi:hypothetical protein
MSATVDKMAVQILLEEVAPMPVCYLQYSKWMAKLEEFVKKEIPDTSNN